MRVKFSYLAAVIGILLIAASFFIVFYLFRGNRSTFLSNDSLKSVNKENENGIEGGEFSSNDRNQSLSAVDKNVLSSSSKDRLNAEPLVPAATSGWRVVTLYGWPGSGAAVYAVSVSQKIVREWLSILDENKTPQPVIHRAICGPDGSFNLPDLKSGVYFIHAEKKGFGPASGILDLSKSWPPDFELILDSEKTIKGDVVDSLNKPLSNVEIYCFKEVGADLSQAPLDLISEAILFNRERKTGIDGRFAIDNLSYRSNYILNIELEGYMPAQYGVLFYDNSPQHIVLKKPCVLEGKVFSEDRKPVKEARVSYRGRIPSQYKGEVKTNEKGYYRFDCVPEGELILQASHSAFGNWSNRTVMFSSKTNKKDIILPEGIKLSVKVMDLKSVPIKGVKVIVKDVKNGAVLGSMKTNENGFAIFSSLNAGEQNLIKVKDLSGKYEIKSGFYSFKEDSVLEYRLRRRFTAKIRILDSETKKPIDHVIVYSCPHHFFSSVQENQTYEKWAARKDYHSGKGDLEFLIGHGEVLDLTLFSEGYEPATAVLMVKDPNLSDYPVTEVLMKKGGSLTGRVINGVTNSPVCGAEVTYYIKGRLIKEPVFPCKNTFSSITGEDGVFTLSGIALGRFFLKVKAAGYAPSIIDTFSLFSLGDSGSNLVYLWPGGILSGTIFGEDGRPLEGAKISVRLPRTKEKVNSYSEMDGKFIIGGLPPGNLNVFVSDMINDSITCSKTKINKTVKMPVAGSVNVDFSFSGNCKIYGIFYMEGKIYDWGAKLLLINNENSVIHSSIVTAGGRYMIDQIPSGIYTLKAFSAISGKGALYEKEISLSPGQELNLDIDITGKAAFGQVRGPDGKPIDAAEVWIIDDHGVKSHHALTDWDGTYSILGVEDGEYSIAARAEGCAESIQGPYEIGGSRPSVKADFALSSGGIARVIVKSGEGKPVPGAPVMISEDWSGGYMRNGSTDYSGICVFDCLGTGKMTVLAGAAGFAPGGAQLNAAPGERTDCDVVLARGGTLRVVVQGKDGTPLPGAAVYLPGFSVYGLDPYRLAGLGLLEPSDGGFRTDGRGEFTVGPLTPGPVTVRVQRGTLFASTEAEITSGKESAVRVVLK